jgi:hypothetical protein
MADCIWAEVTYELLEYCFAHQHGSAFYITVGRHFKAKSLGWGEKPVTKSNLKGSDDGV